MNGPIALSFTLNRHDAIRASRSFIMRQFSHPMLVCLLSIITVTIASMGPLLLEGRIPIGFLIFAYFGYLWPILYLFIWPLSFRSRFIREEKLNVEQNWIIDANQLSIRNIFSQSNDSWKEFGDVYETDEQYLLQYSLVKSLFHFLPKRAFSSKLHELEFRTLIELHTRPIRRINSINLPEPSPLGVWIFTVTMTVIFGLIALKFSFGIL